MATIVTKPALDEILRAVDRLPPFPKVVTRVIPLLRAMAPINEIEAVIRYDQAITARVLSIARSPFFARRYKIRSLRDAIIFLGQRQIVEIILMACSAHYFRGQLRSYDLREGELWAHSVATALLSQIIAEDLQRQRALTIYTAGLLHDIGKTVLDRQVPDYFDTIYLLVRERQITFLEAEREVIGINHQDLGALIAHRWNFPSEVQVGIRFHHSPLDAKHHQDVAAILYAANRIVHSIGIGVSAGDFLQPDADEVLQKLGITQDRMDAYFLKVIEAMEDARSFLTLA
ncbi:MAG: HDOD domain-containing protein [Desulfosoma sp.]|uniref:HDOD domain-containing protein n=1 Tax=Desulfosoma sp. TaxID=2603217 RepID=UPI00404B43B2